jgi:hypothetical protein
MMASFFLNKLAHISRVESRTVMFDPEDRLMKMG